MGFWEFWENLKILVKKWISPTGKLIWNIGPVMIKSYNKWSDIDMALALTDEQKVALSIEPKTAAGNPARLDGVPVWSVSDAEFLTLEVAPDGLSAVATTTGKLGVCQIQVTADADLGDGVRELTALLDIQLVAAEAVTLGIVAGTPEPK